MKSYIASDVRDVNRNTVFRLLADGRQTTKVELARITGISSPTVIKIVDFLIDQGLVAESSGRKTGVGRKPMVVQLRKNAVNAIGVILEGEYIRASIVNLVGEPYPSNLRRADADFDVNLTQVLPEMIQSLLDVSHVDRSSIYGIGLGVPGGYNPETHVVNFAPLIHLNKPTNIERHEQMLSERFHLPVTVANDVNMAALGEYRARKLDRADLIYISLGTGIGAGIILDGALRMGNMHQCGEIGYMSFMNNYAPGTQNPGWLESRINLAALRERFGFDPYRVDTRMLPEIIQYVTAPLATCISNVVSLLDCDTVVLGGVLVQSLGQPFLDRVRQMVRELCVLPVEIEQPVAMDPGVVGASLMVIDHAVKDMLVSGK